jgi:hypothetical protein
MGQFLTPENALALSFIANINITGLDPFVQLAPYIFEIYVSIKKCKQTSTRNFSTKCSI